MRAIVGRLRKLEAEAMLTARPGEIRSKSRHLIKFVGGEGPASEPDVSRTLYSTGELREFVLIDERDEHLTDEATLDRFVESFPITHQEVFRWPGRGRR